MKIRWCGTPSNTDRPARARRVCRRAPAALLACGLALVACQANAELYKCAGANGRVEYTDRPCKGDPNAVPWRPRQPLNVVDSATLTGRSKESKGSKDARPAWLKGPDPVGDCKRRGGTIDPEMRACRLP